MKNKKRLCGLLLLGLILFVYWFAYRWNTFLTVMGYAEFLPGIDGITYNVCYSQGIGTFRLPFTSDCIMNYPHELWNRAATSIASVHNSTMKTVADARGLNRCPAQANPGEALDEIGAFYFTAGMPDPKNGYVGLRVSGSRPVFVLTSKISGRLHSDVDLACGVLERRGLDRLIAVAGETPDCNQVVPEGLCSEREALPNQAL